MATNDFVVKNGLDVTENAIIRETTDSSSKDTGALVVEGGVGIEKKLYVGTDLNVGGTTALVGNTTITGDLAVNGGDITTTQTTFNLVEATATTLNFGGAATTLNIGASSGTTNVRNNLNVVGDVDIDGGDLTVSTTTFNLVNTTATTLNIGGAATTLNIGASTGTLTVKNSQTVFNSTNSIQIPVGTTSQRSGSPTQGQIRYNSELSLYEGYGAGNQWNSLGGVRDVDGDTYILAELTPASNNNTLYFYTGGTNSLSLTASTLDVKSGTTLSVANTTEASSTTTGSVQIAGGVGIAKRLYAGSIESTPIGSSVRSTALFTTLGANGQVSFTAGTASTTTSTGSVVISGGLGVSGAVNAGASSSFAGLTSTSTTTLSPANASVTISPTGTGSVTISPATAGSINNMSIGATTRGSGAFTTLAANSAVTLTAGANNSSLTTTGAGVLTISSGTTGSIDNMTIGATTAATGRFTTITSTIATGTAPLTVTSTTKVTNLNADLLDGLDLHTGTNNEANKIVRTDANGYIQAGWINTTSGDAGTTAIDRVYASYDGYIRYYSPANFRQVLDVPTRTGGSASGTWAISITGNANTATSATSATTSRFVSSPDGDRNAGSILPTTSGQAVRFDFAGAGTTGTGGNYAGVMTYAPWTGTTASTGDASYQLAFGSTAVNGGGLPQLNIRKGIDSTWNTWYTILHSGNYNSYSPTLTGGGASGTWSINISGNAATVTNGVYTTGNQTIGGNKTFTGQTFIPDMFINRVDGGDRGISWYATNYTAWSEYMASAGATNQGPTGNITAPSGNLVTSWALRSFVENVGGYGWTFESGTAQGQPSVVAEIRGSDGSARFNGSLTVGSTITELSSIAYKENVNPIDNALDKVLKLVGVTYDRKDGSTKNEAGLIAEKVAEVIPNIVTEKDGKPDGIQYTKLTAYLIECIKELNAKIEMLEGKLNG